jgi:hypothetical protein
MLRILEGEAAFTFQEIDGDSEEVVSFLKANFSCPTHWPDWNLALSDYVGSRFFYRTCRLNGKLVGICPCHKIANAFTSIVHSGPKTLLMPYGGWIFSEEIRVAERMLGMGYFQEISYYSLPCLAEYNAEYHSPTSSEFLTLLVDLHDDEEKIWMESIDPKRRNMIRKAEKNGISIMEDDKSNLDVFFTVLKSANDRYGLKTFEQRYFVDLFGLATNISFDILWAKTGEKVLAGIVIVRDKNFAIYWLGMTVEGAPNLGQGDLLQWFAIKKAKAAGCRYYDLCTIEKERLPQIYEFKKGFARVERPFYWYGFRPIPYRILRKLSL